MSCGTLRQSEGQLHPIIPSSLQNQGIISLHQHCFHPNGTRIATIHSTNNVSIWDLLFTESGSGGGVTTRLRGACQTPDQSVITALASAPDGVWLAAGTLSGLVCVWKWETMQGYWECAMHSEAQEGEEQEEEMKQQYMTTAKSTSNEKVLSVVFVNLVTHPSSSVMNDEDHFLVSASESNTLTLSHVERKQVLLVIPVSGMPYSLVSCPSFVLTSLPSSSYLVGKGGRSRSASPKNTGGSGNYQQQRSRSPNIKESEASPVGLVTAQCCKHLLLLNVNGEFCQSPRYSGFTSCVKFGEWEGETALMLVGLSNGTVVLHFALEGSPFPYFFASATTASSLGASNNLMFPEATTLTLPSAHTSRVTNLDIAPSQYHSNGGGFVFLSASQDCTVKLWNITKDSLHIPAHAISPFMVISKHTNWISSALFHPNLCFLVTSSHDTTMKIWRLDGSLISSFRGHQGYIRSCSFPPSNSATGHSYHNSSSSNWPSGSGHHNSLYCTTSSHDGSCKVWILPKKSMSDIPFWSEIAFVENGVVTIPQQKVAFGSSVGSGTRRSSSPMSITYGGGSTQQYISPVRQGKVQRQELPVQQYEPSHSQGREPLQPPKDANHPSESEMRRLESYVPESHTSTHRSQQYRHQLGIERNKSKKATRQFSASPPKSQKNSRCSSLQRGRDVTNVMRIEKNEPQKEDGEEKDEEWRVTRHIDAYGNVYVDMTNPSLSPSTRQQESFHSISPRLRRRSPSPRSSTFRSPSSPSISPTRGGGPPQKYSKQKRGAQEEGASYYNGGKKGNGFFSPAFPPQTQLLYHQQCLQSVLKCAAHHSRLSEGVLYPIIDPVPLTISSPSSSSQLLQHILQELPLDAVSIDSFSPLNLLSVFTLKQLAAGLYQMNRGGASPVVVVNAGGPMGGMALPSSVTSSKEGALYLLSIPSRVTLFLREILRNLRSSLNPVEMKEALVQSCPAALELLRVLESEILALPLTFHTSGGAIRKNRQHLVFRWCSSVVCSPEVGTEISFPSVTFCTKDARSVFMALNEPSLGLRGTLVVIEASDGNGKGNCRQIVNPSDICMGELVSTTTSSHREAEEGVNNALCSEVVFPISTRFQVLPSAIGRECFEEALRVASCDHDAGQGGGGSSLTDWFPQSSPQRIKLPLDVSSHTSVPPNFAVWMLQEIV